MTPIWPTSVCKMRSRMLSQFRTNFTPLMFDLLRVGQGVFIFLGLLFFAISAMDRGFGLSAAVLDSDYSSYHPFGGIQLSELTQSQSSPTPSSSSESSGIGSLGSLKSESVSDSLPSSPQTTEKKLFDEVPIKPIVKPDAKVIYHGRNLLNLMVNIRDPKWQYRAARLPPNSPADFFANRSQYHRLGPYGMNTQYVYDTCKECDFNYVSHVIERSQ